MVKHIVLFKLKETLSQEEKLKVMNDFKAAIGAEDDATARKTLETRLKSEQDKIKDQKKI